MLHAPLPVARAQPDKPRPQHGELSEDADASTALLISQLLAQDLAEATNQYTAENYQLQMALADSRPATPFAFPFPPLVPEEPAADDRLISLRLALDTARMEVSRGVVSNLSKLQVAEIADQTQARALQGLYDARQRKEQLDAEFARSLQRTDAEGVYDIDQVAMDGVERVLGAARVQELLRTPAPMGAPGAAAVPPPVFHQDRLLVPPLLGPYVAQSKGKGRELGAAPVLRHPLPPKPVSMVIDGGNGKGRAIDISSQTQSSFVLPPSQVDSNVVVCSICFDPCRLTPNPFLASLAATTSDRVAYGMAIGHRSDGHSYCLGCLTTYITTKLDDESPKAVFPIPCPQCKHEITDETAICILGEANMERWHYRKLLDATPVLFCPNPRCSARVLRNEDGNPQAECPSCKKLICGPCGTLWHQGYNCVQYQALPLGSRDPEDFAVLALANDKNWHRCIKCRAMIELESGCYHMTCICGGEFCFLCGSLWDVRRKRCSKNPPCKLWDEERLLAERQGHRHERLAPRAPARGQAGPGPRAQAYAHAPPAQVQGPLPPAQGHYDRALGLQQYQDLRRLQQYQDPRRLPQVLPQAPPPPYQPLPPQFHMRPPPQQLYAAQPAYHYNDSDSDSDSDEGYRPQEPVHMQQDDVDGNARKRRQGHAQLDWMHDAQGGNRHPFTAEFVVDRRCGYCGDGFATLGSLQQHLANTERHSVLACCGRFFRVRAHLNQHLDSPYKGWGNGLEHQPFDS